MSPDDVRAMLWCVAAQYGFTETEMMRMPLRRLRFWYEGHETMRG